MPNPRADAESDGAEPNAEPDGKPNTELDVKSDDAEPNAEPDVSLSNTEPDVWARRLPSDV